MAVDPDNSEERADCAGVTLAAALKERNRLWAELQLHRSQERELIELRERLGSIEGSGWWRVGKPLRLARRAVLDPALAAKVLLGYLRIFRARLGR